MGWQGKRGRLSTLYLGLAALAMGLATFARAEVHLPNGEYRTSATDLKVKVLGGYVAIERTWQAKNINKGEYAWYFNPAWADLDLEIDSSDHSIRSIGRTGAKFEKQGDDLYVLKESDRSYFISVQRDGEGNRTGLHWNDRSGNAIVYDAAGRIQSYSDRNGVTVRFQRDPVTGQITEVHDHADRPILRYAYADGKVSSISDVSRAPTLRSVSYHYDGADLKEVIDVLGNSWTYTYPGGLLHTQTDPEQHTTTIDYAGNRVTALTDPATNKTTWTYDYDRGTRHYQVTETSAEGKQTSSTYDADGKLIEQEIGTRRVSHLVKDSANVEISYDERNLPTRTEYDANHNPIKVTYPDGSSTSATYDGAHSLPLTRTDELGVVTKYDYDASGNLTTLTEALGLPEQRITTATYDSYGQRLTQTVKGTTPSEDATTTWTYDDYGNVRTITDAENNTTTFAYDAMGNATGRTDARGYFWQTLTNDQGRLTSQIDPLDHEVVITYDKAGNRKTVTDAENNTTTYTYTASNQLETTTDPLGGTATTHYTKDGQRKEEIDANNVKTSYGYDSDGRLTTITDGASNVTTLAYGGGGSNLEGLLVSMVFPTYREEYKYDQRGSRTTVVRVLPGTSGEADRREVTTVGRDAKGQKTSESDPLRRTKQWTYDAFGRLKSVTDAAGGITQYSYDPRDNLKTVTDANQHTHAFSYDNMNRLKIEARPMGQTITYVHDENGSLMTRTNSKGERRTYIYDDANRRTAENQYPADSQAASEAITYSYDRRNLLTGYEQTGDTASGATYGYDAKGQKVDETVTYGTGQNAFTKTIHYAYQANGLKIKLTYPDSTDQTSTYDQNRLATIAIKDNTIAYRDYQWHMPKTVMMSGATRTLTYDPLQRPTEIKSVSVAGVIIMDYRYQYDAAGNIAQRTTEDGDYQYTYDNLDRLTGVTPPVSLQQGSSNPGGLPVERYTYDGVDNRKTSAHQSGEWVYDENNELLSYGVDTRTQTFEYDDNGNTIVQRSGASVADGKTREYIYDAAERLTEVKDNGITIAKYQYDPAGRRFKKETQQGVTWFQYADEGLIAEYAENGAMIRAYGWVLNGPWGVKPEWSAAVSGAGWKLNFYHTDHLGTPQGLTDISGNVVWSKRSEAFGKINGEESSIDNNALRFAGQYEDAETGAYYNYFRYYDPSTGRYIERDPLNLSAGVNFYSYTYQSPTKYIDPDGQFVLVLIPAICAGGGCEAAAAWVLAIAATCSTVLMAEAAGDAIDRTAEKSRDRIAYKTRCTQSPPPNLDKCAEARWKLQRNLDCIAMRVAFSNKWYGGADAAHDGEVENLKIAIEKLEKVLSSPPCCKDCDK